MGRYYKILATLITAGLLGAAAAGPVYAESTISSISLKVHAELDSGDTVTDNIDTSKGSKEDVYVYSSSSKFWVDDAEWVTSSNKELKIGDQPKMKVELTADDDYKFRSGYSSSSVSVSGGEYVSSNRHNSSSLTVTIRLDPIKGTYDPPEELEWSNTLGRARWDHGDISSEAYDVYLYRGSTVMKKLEGYKGTSYNFFPYMTKEGDYRFKVRTVPYTDDEKKYGKKSEWAESDEQYVGEDEVSDGSGQTDDNGNSSGTSAGTTGDVGWKKEGDTWYFRYPDGSYQKDGWFKWNDRWYLFDGDGRMLTGWQNRNDQSYYLRESGEMYIGWAQYNGKWYYLNPTPDQYEGALVKNQWLTLGDKTYYLNEQGVMVEDWYKVGEYWYYFYPGQGNKAVNTVISGFRLDANGVWQR